MARRKKKDKELEVSLESTVQPDTDLESEPELDDSNDVSLLEEESPEETVEAEAEEKPKTKRARRPRARRPSRRSTPARGSRKNSIESATLLAALSTPVENKNTDDAGTRPNEEFSAATAEFPAPVLAREEMKSGAEPVETPPSLPVEPTAFNETVSNPSILEKNMESFARNLARVNTILVDFSANQDKEENSKQQPPWVSIGRATLVTKIAVGMSAFAIVLSLVSISLSQSAREAAIEKTADTAKSQTSEWVSSVPTKPEPALIEERPISKPSVATPRPRPSRLAIAPTPRVKKPVAGKKPSRRMKR